MHDAPWEGNTSGYHTVFKDDDIYRMYYRGSHDTRPFGGSGSAHPDVTPDAKYKALGYTKTGTRGLYAFSQAPDGKTNILDVNEAGLAVGMGGLPSNAYVLELDDTWTLLPSATSGYTAAYDINDNNLICGQDDDDGQVVGRNRVTDDNLKHAVIWEDTGSGWTVQPLDADNDGQVDDADAAILAANWQTPSGAVRAQGDFNADGRVDDIDATLLAANWLSGVAPTPAVPEPGTWLLLASACLVLFARKTLCNTCYGCCAR